MNAKDTHGKKAGDIFFLSRSICLTYILFADEKQMLNKLPLMPTSFNEKRYTTMDQYTTTGTYYLRSPLHMFSIFGLFVFRE